MKAVEDAYGRNCVSELPSGRPTEVLPTPWCTEVLVIHDTEPSALRRLVTRDGYDEVRFWLSPCGDHAVAWTAGDVAHFQISCGLMDRGWHQGRIELGGKAGSVIVVQDPVADLLRVGKAGSRMAGIAYTERTSARTLPSEPSKAALALMPGTGLDDFVLGCSHREGLDRPGARGA